MIPHFTETEKAVYYPTVKATYLRYQAVHEGHIAGTTFGLFGAAWLQHLFFSLPTDRSLTFAPLQPGATSGYPIHDRLEFFLTNI